MQDIVAWVTLGAFHIPHSEDIPIVQSTGVELKFFLLPFNFFDEDPSLASRDNVRSTPRKGGGHNKVYSGVEEKVTCTPRSEARGIRSMLGVLDILLMSSVIVTCTY